MRYKVRPRRASVWSTICNESYKTRLQDTPDGADTSGQARRVQLSHPWRPVETHGDMDVKTHRSTETLFPFASLFGSVNPWQSMCPKVVGFGLERKVIMLQMFSRIALALVVAVTFQMTAWARDNA